GTFDLTMDSYTCRGTGHIRIHHPRVDSLLSACRPHGLCHPGNAGRRSQRLFGYRSQLLSGQWQRETFDGHGPVHFFCDIFRFDAVDDPAGLVGLSEWSGSFTVWLDLAQLVRSRLPGDPAVQSYHAGADLDAGA